MSQASTQLDRSKPNGDWNHHSAELRDANIHYVREGSGDPVILLHGWPEFWWAWHRNIPDLAYFFDVIAPDLRGFGDSRSVSESQPSLNDHVADIIALADHLGVEKFAIASHDVGAYIAQQITRLHPDRVTGLFFFNCPYPGIGKRWATAEHLNQIWYQSFNQLEWANKLVGYNRDTCKVFFEGMLRHWSYDQSSIDDQIEIWVDNFMKPGNVEGGFAWYSATHTARMDLVRDGAPPLPKISVPTYIFWGEHDPIIPPAWADRIGEYFEIATIEIAENAGHFVQLEAPEVSNQKMINFFKGVFSIDANQTA